MDGTKAQVLLPKITSKYVIKGGKVPRKNGENNWCLDSDDEFPDTEVKEAIMFKRLFPEYKHIL